MRYFLTALAALGLLAGPAGAAPSYEAVNRALAEGVILPAYERYAEAMAALAPAIAPYCEQQDDEALAAARKGFADAMTAWQQVQPVAFGPISEEGRASRVQFWPDKHGTAGRQLRQALAAKDPALIEDGVAGRSVALQSLASLEQLLYGDAEGPDAYACRLALAIGRFQDDLAREILAAWEGEDGFYRRFTEAASGNDLFYDAAEAHTLMFKTAIASLDIAVTQKLERPLGERLETARPKRAESWRSQRSLDNLIANLEILQALYLADGGLKVWLPAAGQEGLDQLLRDVLAETLASAEAIGMPLEQAVADAAARSRVEGLLEVVKRLRTLFATTLADAADVTLGFNATDGD